MKKFILIDCAVVSIVIFLFSFTREKEMPQIQNDGDVKQLPVVKNVAFKRGEKLVFRMHYGVIEAGEATLGITEETKELAGRKTFHVVGLGVTKGMFEFFYSVRDRYETYIDEQSIIPWMFLRSVNEGGYKIDQVYVFNHYKHKVDVGGGEMFPIEPSMQDMLSAFYSARTMDLSAAKEGELYSINCFMDKEVWPLKIKFIKKP